MATGALVLKIVLTKFKFQLLFPPFWIWLAMRFKLKLTLRCTILQYGVQRATFILSLTLYSTILQYGG